MGTVASCPDSAPQEVTVEEARAAAERIRDFAIRTPLVRLPLDEGPEIWLKLENLQPIRSFKIRGAASVLAAADPATLVDGVWTASAGNMAQGVAWCARRLGVPATVVVPEGAPRAKIEAIEALGAAIVTAPFGDWFRIYETHEYAGMTGAFVHAFSDREVMAGNATIALEIVDELDAIDAVVIPYGGGGLSCGIAAAFRELSPATKRFAAEVATAAPLAAAFAAGAPVAIEHRRSFVDGIGGPVLFDEMWALASGLLDGALVVELEAVCDALRTLVRACAVVAEGAGATPVAAALAGQAGSGRIVCIVSGGNIDGEALRTILDGGVPS